MAASTNLQFPPLSFPLCFQLHRPRILNLFLSQRPFSFFGNIRVFGSNLRSESVGIRSICCVSRTTSQIEKVDVPEESDPPPFDINLAVILAGFAFEAYYTSPGSIGRQEIDAAGCKTAYLSETFVREIYDGQLFIKLKKGFNFPAMDPWGTSDPYVVMQLGGQVVKSRTKWGKKDPEWNEEFTLNIKLPSSVDLQIAAWDANLVTPHKRMGNASINLECLCDGNVHELLVELEGMGGGGNILLEIKYMSFDEIEEDKRWWNVPFVSEFLRKNGFDTALKRLVGSDTVQVHQFVQYAFSQLKTMNDTYVPKGWFSNSSKQETQDDNDNFRNSEVDASLVQENNSEGSSENGRCSEGVNQKELQPESTGVNNVYDSMEGQTRGAAQSNKHFWKDFADAVTQNVVQKLGKPLPEKIKWDGLDVLNKIGIQLGRVADASYIESGLATPGSQDLCEDKESESSLLNIGRIHSSLPDIRKATEDLLRQTDSIFGALMVLAATVPSSKKDSHNAENSETEEGDSTKLDGDVLDYLKSDLLAGLDERRAEEMRALFSTAESAMEAWAMLATSLGHSSFIKSEFEKICFLDNSSTDTQVAIWRDPARKRLVVAFRGTEQVRWKDLRTDFMIAPAGKLADLAQVAVVKSMMAVLNPERIGGDFKQEVQVHSGFLSAYDSVRIRIMSLIRQAIGYTDNGAWPHSKWHVYATGHSLGGALATLLALELSSSQLAKCGAIMVTMYNFGSPRVGNRRFAEIYNEKVKDSWRLVNHRDIIPAIPRLMGYCHVAQPVYLAAGDLTKAWENMEPLDDGYEGVVIGELTPDIIVSEFMKGEKELVEKILQTEINIFRSIRDGSALMQHMEDFYYITLLEVAFYFLMSEQIFKLHRRHQTKETVYPLADMVKFSVVANQSSHVVISIYSLLEQRLGMVTVSKEISSNEDGWAEELGIFDLTPRAPSEAEL